LLSGRIAESDGMSALFSDLWWSRDHGGRTACPLQTTDRWSVVFGGKRDHGANERRWDEGENRHNLHSAVVALRGWNPEPGEWIHLPLEIAAV
jgi:hypothetical protein